MPMYKKYALLLLCSVSLTGCVQKNDKEKTRTRTEIGTTIHIQSEEEFNTIISTNDNVLVDFYASWCGPCQRMSPIIDDLAKEIHNVTFVKVDIEKFNSISKRFNVRSIPTLVFFKNGNKAHQLAGARNKAELRTEINKAF